MKTVDDTGTAVALRDGSRVVVRPARPDDRDLLLAGFERLRPESCDQRLAPMAELTDNIASLLIAQGRDPVFVSRQLGHANPAITLRVYAHLFDAARHARGSRNALDAEFGSPLADNA